MINTIEYAKVFQTVLDKQVVQGATSGWMEQNAGNVIYNGGNEIKIPEISTQGLGNYDRDKGYKQGAVTYSYQTHKMTQDRGRMFRLDAMDVDEMNFQRAATELMGTMQAEHVIPEIDAYRYSKLSQYAGITAKKSITTSNVLNELKTQLYEVAGTGVPLSSIVISMSYGVYSTLSNSSEITKQLSVIDFAKGDINTQVKAIDGVPIIPVSNDRMFTSFVFYDGETESDGAESNPTPDQREGGFAPAADAKSINWIICSRRYPIAISKTDKVKIISPEINQTADAWDIHFRKYHDLIVPERKRKTIAVSIAQ